jgi:hypothetical protein
VTRRRRPVGRPPIDPTDPSVSVQVRLPSKQFDDLCRRALHARRSLPAQVRLMLKARQFRKKN